MTGNHGSGTPARLRRIAADGLFLVGVFVALRVALAGQERLEEISVWLGGSDSSVVDALAGWVPIGGLLVFLGVLGARRARPWSRPEALAWALVGLPWALFGAVVLWTPLAGDFGAWSSDLSAGGEAFRNSVVMSHWALLASGGLCLIIGLAQIVSPQWQPGNAINERRSVVASFCAIVGPQLAALVVTLTYFGTSGA